MSAAQQRREIIRQTDGRAPSNETAAERVGSSPTGPTLGVLH